MMMGSFSRLVSLHGRAFGEAAESLYADYNVQTHNSMGVLPTSSSLAISPQYGAYHDIIAGTNTLYQALPGYDLVSGIGSVDIAALEKDFAAY